LLWIVLRRVTDALVTLIPLIVAGLVTLEICALSNFQLNYADSLAGIARGRRGVQDLLRDGVEARRKRLPGISSHARGLLQHTSDRDPHSEVCGSPISQVYRAWVSCWLYHLCAP
jgi:hypothetical protein